MTSVLRLATELCLAAVFALGPGSSCAKEVRPPKWSRDVLDTFFEDARSALEGKRPEYGVRRDERLQAAATNGSTLSSEKVNWSEAITADALEMEIKRAAGSLAGSVTTPSAFKGGGFKDVRRELSELAILFAVTAQWKGDARWKDSAAGLRDVFARSAANTKVASDATYREAEARSQDLADLIRGARPQVPKATAAVNDWSQVAGRPPLMQRLNIAHQDRLLRWLADENAFQTHQIDVRHEAQVLELLANVIHRNAYEFSDDETFVGYANELQQAANDVAISAESKDYRQARDAIRRVTNACADCHDGYRG